MFMCDICQYNSEDKSNYNRHMKSKSHLVKEKEKITGKTKEENIKEQKRIEKAQKQLDKIQLEREKMAMKMQIERDKMEAKAKADAEKREAKAKADAEKMEAKAKADAEKREAKAKADAEKMEFKRQESEARNKIQEEREQRIRDKQRMKEEALKKIEEDKLAVLEAKKKQEEEDNKPYETDFVFDDTNFLTISKMMDFNFKHNMIPKHRKYLIHKLLKSMLDVPKLRCFRINNGNVEMFNGEWLSHSCGCVDDDDLKYNMKDILHYLINFAKNYPDYHQYRNPFRIEVENSLGQHDNVRLKELKRILECNDVSFIDEKMKMESEYQTEKAEQAAEEEIEKSKNRDKDRERRRRMQEEQDRKDEQDLRNNVAPDMSNFAFQFIIDGYKEYEKKLKEENEVIGTIEV